MKPIDSLSDSEFETWLRRAAVMPDAPASWVRGAVQAFDARPVRDLAKLVEGLLRRVVAVLSFDSWAPQAQLAQVRSVPSQARHLLFSSQGRDIDLRITPAAQDYAVAGQILGPDEAGVVVLCRDGDEPPSEAALHRVPLNEFGEFRVEGVRRGTYRLILRVGHDEIALPPIAVGDRSS